MGADKAKVGVGIVIVHSTFFGSGVIVLGVLAVMMVDMGLSTGKEEAEGASSKKLDSHSSCVMSSSSHCQYLSKIIDQ